MVLERVRWGKEEGGMGWEEDRYAPVRSGVAGGVEWRVPARVGLVFGKGKILRSMGNCGGQDWKMVSEEPAGARVRCGRDPRAAACNPHPRARRVFKS